MWQKILINIVVLSSVVIMFKGCTGKVQQHHTPKFSAASVKKPAMAPDSAFLVFLRYDGEMDDSVYIWMNYLGSLQYAGKDYSHIHGFVNYLDERRTDTVYYEDMYERKNKHKFDFNNFLYTEDIGQVKIKNKKDSTFLFEVLEIGRSVYNGNTYVKVPAVSLDTMVQSDTYNYWGYAGSLSVSITNSSSSGSYQVLFRENTKISFMYKSHCDSSSRDLIADQKISFVDRTDGRIYFLEKACYLELVDKADLPRIRELY